MGMNASEQIHEACRHLNRLELRNAVLHASTCYEWVEERVHYPMVRQFLFQINEPIKRSEWT